MAGIQDIVGFHGSTVDELESAFHEAVDNYVRVGLCGSVAKNPAHNLSVFT